MGARMKVLGGLASEIGKGVRVREGCLLTSRCHLYRPETGSWISTEAHKFANNILMLVLTRDAW
jgi:hypothetical protein